MSKKLKKELKRIIIALVLFFIIFITDKIINLTTLIPNRNGWLLALGLYLFIYILIGYDVLFKAFRNIIHGQVFDENFLMCIATLGAFGLAIYKGCTNSGEIDGMEEGCAVLLFYQVGEFFQSYAVGKSRKDISALMDIRPDYANVYQENEVVCIDPEEVKIDDIIVVKPGEKIPLDGVVIKGKSSIDAKALTGESLPVDVCEGMNVISGCVNLSSTIDIKVCKTFYDSTVSKILDLVENAASQKSKTENFITKFARFYTPIVVVLALLLALIPSLITRDVQTWVYRALSFLVVSCPCALVISIPLSFFAGIGGASKKGILIKGSSYLECLNKANVFVFDKTGTLTKGNFVVTKVTPEQRKEEILSLAYKAERGSNHPIAHSIISAYNKKDEELPYTILDIPGQGIEARFEEDVILCGNHKLIKANNIDICEEKEAGTIIYVAHNGSYVGSILICDEIKLEAKEVISSLNSMGNKTIMLTGDNDKVAASVSEELKLSSYRSSLLPQDKVEEVEKLLQNKQADEVLCFVGDGINDAPVLMRSDIGIAMGGVGSDAAIESADVVLMNDDLRGIVKAKEIAKKTMRIVYQNIYFSLGVKIGILILSALGLASMWLAVFGDVGVAVIAILNAMRCSKITR
ncbi:MAG: heavy metal translocating P-type ATPase [Bacilli bacterium]